MRRLLSKLFQFINLSIIKRDKLNSIDRERKLYRHEVDRLNFIFLNDRVKILMNYMNMQTNRNLKYFRIYLF